MNEYKNTFPIKPKNKNQELCIKNIEKNDITFIIGPAGTGKTLIAIANAIFLLKKNKIKKIILVKPIVEVDEQLGFLPGNMEKKVEPYFQPIFDILNNILNKNIIKKLIENEIIEISPLAYMRGRNINNSFILLDEGQNTTINQMKMFLTRISFNSKIVVTGDISQIDIKNKNLSGLKHAISILKNIKGINFIFFETKDIIRHKLIEKIINAYNND